MAAVYFLSYYNIHLKKTTLIVNLTHFLDAHCTTSDVCPPFKLFRFYISFSKII